MPSLLYIVCYIGQLLTYAGGICIIINFQRKKIGLLKDRLDSQASLVTIIERFMNIFKVDTVEQYVALVQKKFEAEKEITLHESEATWRKRTKEGIEYATTEILALLKFATMLIAENPNNPVLIHALKEMKETNGKNSLIEVREKAMKSWDELFTTLSKDKSIGATILAQLLFRGNPDVAKLEARSPASH